MILLLTAGWAICGAIATVSMYHITMERDNHTTEMNLLFVLLMIAAFVLGFILVIPLAVYFLFHWIAR